MAKKEPRGGTYLLVDPKTGRVMRTGRTNDLVRRRGEHRRDPVTRPLDFVIDKKTDSYPAQRGREQILHERHLPPLNKANPIDPRNKNRQKYLDAARALGQD